MDTNINFTNDLNGESDVKTSFNLPRKIYNLTAGRAVADGAIVVESESCTYETMLNIDRTRILNEASLLLLPNTYKEGKLYSHKPLNGNGDFTATRATTATRVNSSGLVEIVPYNLFTYSEMFSDTSWQKAATTITANTTTAPDGTLTADTLTSNGSTSGHFLYQTPVATIGTPYSFSVYVKRGTNNFIQLLTGSIASNGFANFDLLNGVVGTTSIVTASIQSVGNDWYRCVAIFPTIGNASGGFFIGLITSATSLRAEVNSLSTSVFIWGAQLVEGTSALNYLRTETRLNIPRLDYSLGSCPNILLEPQRTNLALQSSSFDNASWSKTNITVVANAETAPDGTLTADTITANGVSGVHVILCSSTLSSATTYSLSVFLKKGTNDFIQLGGGGSLFGAEVWANFNLNTGTIGSQGTLTTARIENFGNGWYRCTIIGSTISSGTNTGMFVQLVNSGTSLRGESNTLSTSVFLWGAQLEAGAYATSYIPTTTASVTRNADSITRNNIFTNGLITATGGTWFLELRNNIVKTRDGAGDGGIFINTSTSPTTNNGITLRNTGTQRYVVVKVVSGVLTNLYTTTTDTVKIAIKWNGSTADIFQNGVKVVSATAFTTTAMQNLIADGQMVQTFINEMALFTTPLTDAQCIALTT